MILDVFIKIERKGGICIATNTIYSYLRVSTIDQDTAKNKADILNFANAKGFLGKVEFIEEQVSGLTSWKKRKLYHLTQSMNKGDVLLVPELSRLGRSLVEVLEVLNALKDKGVSVYSVKEDFKLNDDGIQSKVMRTMLGLFAEIERDLISARTKEELAAAKKLEKKLGRPKGAGRSKLDPHKKEIIHLLKNGAKKGFIAKRYGVTAATMSHWLKKHNLQDVKPEI